MKLLRTFLIVLLAALLPVRGAMAAAMLCPPGSQSEGTVGSTGPEREASALAAAEHAQAAHDQAETASADHCNSHGDSAPHAGGCSLCASCCAMTPLLGSMPKILAPLATAGAGFPTLSAPAVTHQSGGQDRPPRGI